MRLDKYVSNMLGYSRKEVKIIAKNGRVTVNSSVVTNPDAQINPGTDCVSFDGQKIEYKPYIYLMLNKPQGYVSATSDKKYKTVIDLVPEEFAHYDIFPMGRLDADTEGLLIITNNGTLAHDILSPKKHVDKVYFAKVDGTVTQKEIDLFAEGIVIDDGYKTLPAKLEILKMDKFSEIELTIKEGKFHQVKRMFEAVGMEVVYLKRIIMGGVPLDEILKLGQVRELTDEEITTLKEAMNHAK